MSVILEIENISKKFKIYHNKQPYLSLRDTIVDAIKHPSKVFQTETEEFWALKDVSFTVNEGESIGIIGKNGAGKSTLLKILSRITPPTKGKITLRGRVASLLEVGTGFHPELTGRENVYFNGAILGMKRSEIKRKFDEIVAFAGVEKFIDTPLKHYSSGMQLRLAFAVAAFLEAEILVVDEVLAVGDAEFQKKCLGKMEDVTKKEGRTVLFVSHNMGAVRQLCSRGVYLRSGSLIVQDTIENCIQIYLHDLRSNSDILEGEWHYPYSKIIEKIVIKSDNRPSGVISSGNDLEIYVKYRTGCIIQNPCIGIIIRDELNQPLIAINNKHYQTHSNRWTILNGNEIKIKIPIFPLYAGYYSCDIHIGDWFKDYEVIKNAFSFQVVKNNFTESSELPDENFNKVIIKNVEWSIIN